MDKSLMSTEEIFKVEANEMAEMEGYPKPFDEKGEKAELVEVKSKPADDKKSKASKKKDAPKEEPKEEPKEDPKKDASDKESE